MRRRSVLLILLVGLAQGLSASVLASSSQAEAFAETREAMSLSPDPENGLVVYEVCAACHGPEGWGNAKGTYAQIAGQHPKVLIKQLADIRALNRDNPAMYPFSVPEAIGGTQAIADVTAYIAKLPMNPNHGKGPWAERTFEYRQGEKLYKVQCAPCHGENGEGKDASHFPRIQGQHYEYMLRQFEWIRDGKRRNANPAMAAQVKGFSDRESRMVINYVTRMPVPKEDLAPSPRWKNPDFD